MITIVICTHNRSAVLKDSLDSFSMVEMSSSDDVELIVVDNGSRDSTNETVRRWISKSNVNCRYVFEAELGLSNARNRGMREALGQWIVFVDDDVYFDRHWLEEIKSRIAFSPDAACISGAVLPHYEAGRPTWLDPDPEWLNMEGMFSITLFGSEERYLGPTETPVGANLAFRLQELKALGGFSGVLGRHGNNLLSKEESELYFRFNRAGYFAVSAPKAIVHHRISAERTTKKWLLRRFYWQGISQVLFEGLTCPRARGEILRIVILDMSQLRSFLLGDSWSPLRIYWQVRGWRFYHRAFATYKFALIRKRLALVFAPGKYETCCGGAPRPSDS